MPRTKNLPRCLTQDRSEKMFREVRENEMTFDEFCRWHGADADLDNNGDDGHQRQRPRQQQDQLHIVIASRWRQVLIHLVQQAVGQESHGLAVAAGGHACGAGHASGLGDQSLRRPDLGISRAGG